MQSSWTPFCSGACVKVFSPESHHLVMGLDDHTPELSLRSLLVILTGAVQVSGKGPFPATLTHLVQGALPPTKGSGRGLGRLIWPT